MRATRTNDAALIVAAQAGDRRALAELITAYLPLVYTLVRRALGGHPDVDDVVQEIMLRVVRQLRLLRAPESFRPWLAAIAVHHVSTHRHRGSVAAGRTAALDELADVPDADADVEGWTLLQVELSAQRRQVVRATQWIDPDDRTLLSLWWLETAGQLTRTELAAALDVSVAHAGVRVQRMRDQLDLGRSVVAALAARPRCPRLGAVVVGWDGSPSPLWRKRIARHTRSCTVCARAADGMVAAERLLAGFALVPAPLALTAALLGKSAAIGAAATGTAGAATAAVSGTAGVSGGAGAKAGIIGHLVQAFVAHPVAASVAAVAAGALAVGITTTTPWPHSGPTVPEVFAAPTAAAPATPNPIVTPTPVPGASLAATLPPPPPPPTVARPSATDTAPLGFGRVSLESANATRQFVATSADLGVLVAVGADGGGPVGEQATFEAVPGLADPDCFSFRSRDGRYLRHIMWRVRLYQDEGTPLFRGDATFCVRTGSLAGSVWLESSNYPGWFVHHRGDKLWVDHSDGSAPFQADSSFLVRPPLAR